LADENALWIDGKPYSQGDLTLGEENEFRHYLYRLAPENDIEQAGIGDVIAALIAVIKRRDDKAFELEDALKFKRSDVERPPTKARTRAATKK
jgi:hypothetical protein